MSSEDVLTSRLADLESDAFHLKLRNYYLERRVSRSLHGAENSEEQLVKLLEDAPEVRIGPREDAEREKKKRTAAEVALEILRSERSVAEGRVPEEAARELRALRDEVAAMTRAPRGDGRRALARAAALAAAAEDATRAALRARDDAEAAAAAERRTGSSSRIGKAKRDPPARKRSISSSGDDAA
ncbi:hypothetical protein SO694_00032259 [Aureococcus anophagefferens]|uniref:Centrosomin N-terminal motif 1 domain-containing protein n=1 Tax=Aureococcus anophagefferens TaxID=44056 RepID=A0ABR1FKD8_AURAN